MFDWTKENIVNSPSVVLVDEMPVPGSDTDTRKRILFKRMGEYYADSVVGGKVYKTSGYEGEQATLSVDLDGIVVADRTVPNLFQATLKIKMFNKFLGEYANANWQLFGKPILAGFSIAEDATDEDIAGALFEAIKEAVPVDNKFLLVDRVEGTMPDGTPNGQLTKLVFTLPDCYADFESFALEVYDPTGCDSCLGEYHRVSIDDKRMEIVHNVEPFATGEWIRENLRFPSYPNMRYAPLYADEQPIPGAKYTQYSFVYSVPQEFHGGLGFVGQKLESETKHIFYVIESAVADIDAAFTDAGLTLDTVHVHQTHVDGPADAVHPVG